MFQESVALLINRSTLVFTSVILSIWKTALKGRTNQTVLNVLGVLRLAVHQTCYTWKLEEFSKLVSALLAVTFGNLKKKKECEKNPEK